MQKEARAFTYADYLSWPAGERWELIDGAAYDMSPAPNRRHQEIVMFVSGELYQFLRDKPCDVRLAADKDAVRV